jgi:hypothetical protein
MAQSGIRSPALFQAFLKKNMAQLDCRISLAQKVRLTIAPIGSHCRRTGWGKLGDVRQPARFSSVADFP